MAKSFLQSLPPLGMHHAFPQNGTDPETKRASGNGFSDWDKRPRIGTVGEWQKVSWQLLAHPGLVLGRFFCFPPFSHLFAFLTIALGFNFVPGQERIQIMVNPHRPRQVFEGLGAGAIFFEGHITSLAARNKYARQEELYDAMFTQVNTRYLQLMIREIHEPQNDNADPYTPGFSEKDFDYCKHTIQIAKAALKRRPDLLLYATLYTPPPWMKTNNAASGGGQAKATLKPGM